VALGPRYRFGGRRLAVDVHAEALGGWVWASGAGFSGARSDDHGDLGLGAGARGAVRLGRSLWAWLGAALQLWWPQEVGVLGADGRLSVAPLPPYDLLVSAGLAVGVP
jgi:hypothetical protein